MRIMMIMMVVAVAAAAVVVVVAAAVVMMMMVRAGLTGLFWRLPGVIIVKRLLILLAKIRGFIVKRAAAESRETKNGGPNIDFSTVAPSKTVMV